jgi:hypothetical protein
LGDEVVDSGVGLEVLPVRLCLPVRPFLSTEGIVPMLHHGLPVGWKINPAVQGPPALRGLQDRNLGADKASRHLNRDGRSRQPT